MSFWRIRQEGDTVLVFDETGRTLLHAPWNQALAVAAEIAKAAKAAEEVVKHEQIAYDNAIILKTGLPIGLTNNPAIKDEAVSAALYDPKLRRYMGSGIQSGEQFGTPTIKQTPKRDN